MSPRLKTRIYIHLNGKDQYRNMCTVIGGNMTFLGFHVIRHFITKKRKIYEYFFTTVAYYIKRIQNLHVP